jgi:hydroxymethylbilane synthase
VPKLILGTRGSALALWQARHVATSIQEHHPDVEVVERIIKTEGDIHQTEPLGRSDVGVFVRRIEQAMLAGEIDLAVHSLKDLPTSQPDDLVIASVPPRHDPRDVLLSTAGYTFEELPAGTVIGTGSFRRRTMLLHARPELQTAPVRGNVDTRIRKLAEGEYGAIVLALAGLERLGLDKMPYRPITVEVLLPAVGQGALGLETRADDTATREWIAELDHPATHTAVIAERSFLHELGGGCLAPATAFGEVRAGRVELRAAVGDADGVELIRDHESGPVEDAADVGNRLARRMKSAGATRLLEKSRDEAERPGPS